MEVFDRNKNYETLKKKVQRANNAIARIERDYGENSWGVNRLYDKLRNETFNGITKSGRVRITKTMSDEQLKGIEKQVNNFLKNKATSTLRGIKKVKKDVKASLKATLGDIEHDITDAEINKLYNLVEDKDKRSTTESIGASTIWTTITEAKDISQQNGKLIDEDEYFKLVEQRGNLKLNDEDKDFLEEIYLKYFNKM